MKFKGAIFDLDGTLANTLEDLRTAVGVGLKKLGLTVPSLDEFVMNVGAGTDNMIMRSLKEHYTKENLSFVKECYLEHYNEHFLDKTVAYDGLVNLIEDLNNNGFKLAVVSNKIDFMTEKLVEKLFGNNFSVIFGQKEGYPTKPNPALTLLALQQLGIKKEECAFVGDSDIDMKTANNAGLYAVGVSWGFRKKEALIKNGAKIIANNAQELRKILLQGEL